ncbi:MAG: PxKF domain-containing protein [Chloroflexota bacterium]
MSKIRRTPVMAVVAAFLLSIVPALPVGAADGVAPTIVSIAPAAGATGVAVGTNLTVTFSEPVDVTDAWFSVSCGITSTHEAVASGGPVTFTIDPNADFGRDEDCTLGIPASQVTAQGDPLLPMAENSITSFHTAAAADDPPTVDAGGPYSVAEGLSVTVNATGNDPDGGPLTYAWDLDGNGTFETAGQSATFSAAGLQAPLTQTIAVEATDATEHTATDSAIVNVVWNFGGFGGAVPGRLALNGPNAGSTIVVKFQLGGDQGLDIFAAGYPASASYVCGTTPPLDASIPTTGPGLDYTVATGTYSYPWKTEKAWAGTCRTFVLGLADGTRYYVDVHFKP